MRQRNKGREASHKERILTWARAGHVIHQDDWYSNGADGGGPIKSVRSRIPELESDGYRFHHTTRDDGSVEYRLAHVPEPQGRDYVDDRVTAAGGAQDLAAEQLPLELADAPAPSSTPRPGLYDWDGAE